MTLFGPRGRGLAQFGRRKAVPSTAEPVSAPHRTRPTGRPWSDCGGSRFTVRTSQPCHSRRAHTLPSLASPPLKAPSWAGRVPRTACLTVCDVARGARGASSTPRFSPRATLTPRFPPPPSQPLGEYRLIIAARSHAASLALLAALRSSPPSSCTRSRRHSLLLPGASSLPSSHLASSTALQSFHARARARLARPGSLALLV